MCFNCKIIWAVVIVLAIVGLFFMRPQNVEQPSKISQAIINSTTLNLEIADTVATQSKGLGGKMELADDYGMLFIFPEKKSRTFWMKGMLIPIDIIWIDESTIIGYEENVQSEPGVEDGRLKLYRSSRPIDKVLEVRAGLVEEKSWQIGEEIKFK